MTSSHGGVGILDARRGGRRPQWRERLRRAWGTGVWGVCAGLLSLYLRLRVRLVVDNPGGLPASGAALLAANHVSYLDPVVVAIACHRLGRKVRFLGVNEIFDKPVLGWLLRQGRHVPVQPHAPGLALLAARRRLEAGELVLIYPEGTIPAAGAVIPARPGIGFLSLRTGTPILPLATLGLERNRTRWPRAWRRRPVRLAIGTPLPVTASDVPPSRATATALSELALSEVRRLARQLEILPWPAPAPVQAGRSLASPEQEAV